MTVYLSLGVHSTAESIEYAARRFGPMPSADPKTEIEKVGVDRDQPGGIMNDGGEKFGGHVTRQNEHGSWDGFTGSDDFIPEYALGFIKRNSG